MKIKLTQNKFTVVDDKNFDLLNQDKWHTQKNENIYYAVRHITICSQNKQKIIYMHRLILEKYFNRKLKPWEEIDHINGNGLDNRRCNLQIVTRSQHKMLSKKIKTKTSSKYKGVSWHKNRKKWVSYIRLNGKLIHLGCFKNEIKAAQVYDQAAKELFGEFTRYNFNQ